jgi:hypothetical protein
LGWRGGGWRGAGIKKTGAAGAGPRCSVLRQISKDFKRGHPAAAFFPNLFQSAGAYFANLITGINQNFINIEILEIL